MSWWTGAVAATSLPLVPALCVDEHELAHHAISGLFFFSSLCHIHCACHLDQSPTAPNGISTNGRLLRRGVLYSVYLYCAAYAVGAWLDPRLKPVAAVLEQMLVFSMVVFWMSYYNVLRSVDCAGGWGLLINIDVASTSMKHTSARYTDVRGIGVDGSTTKAVNGTPLVGTVHSHCTSTRCMDSSSDDDEDDHPESERLIKQK